MSGSPRASTREQESGDVLPYCRQPRIGALSATYAPPPPTFSVSYSTYVRSFIHTGLADESHVVPESVSSLSLSFSPPLSPRLSSLCATLLPPCAACKQGRRSILSLLRRLFWRPLSPRSLHAIARQRQIFPLYLDVTSETAFRCTDLVHCCQRSSSLTCRAHVVELSEGKWHKRDHCL